MLRVASRADQVRVRLVISIAAALMVWLAAIAASAEESKRTVAVLRFRVHSAKPIDYLGESIANLIRSRLEARSEVEVIPPALLAEAGPQATDAEFQQVAIDLGADAIVSGSVTELAGHFSLDVRVTPAAMGLRSHTFVLTAQRDDELLARVNELADQVLAQVVGAEAALVADVQLIGPPEVVEGLSAVLETRKGDGYDPAVVEEDLASLRQIAEVANATVETERGPEGVIVRFQVIGSQRILTSDLPKDVAGTIVAEVRVSGNRRIEVDAIKARIKTQAGNRYSSTQISKDVAAIYSLGFFSNVRVFREAGPSGWVVEFLVEENPVVRQISISGNENLDGDDIRDILTLTTGSALDYPLLYENRARIEGIYRAQGYYLAEVKYEIVPLGEASVSVDFVVTENEKLKLREINFTGNEVFSDKKLRTGFQTKLYRFWSPATSWLDNSGTYSEPLFLQDLRLIETLYQENGYLQSEVGYPDVLPLPEGLIITVEITEGPQFRVGEIDVAGDNTMDVELLRAMVNLKSGDIFNRSYLTEDIEALRAHYTERGFFLADVAPVTDLSVEEQVVDVVFEVTKGPLYFVREIGISGNTRTVDPVVRHQVPLVEGQLYSSRSIELARLRLNQLGFFEEVELRTEPTEDPQQIDVEVEVVERPTGSFSFGAGYSSRDAFLLTGSLSETNFLGRGYAVNLSADFSSKSQRFYIQFRDDFFLGSDFSFGASVFRTSVEFDDFEQDRTGLELSLGHTLSDDHTARGWLSYSFSNRDIEQNSNVDSSAIIFREVLGGSETSSAAAMQFSIDRRNDPVAPTSGYEMTGFLEFAGLGGFSRQLKAEGRASYFMPAPDWLLDRSAFAVRGGVGYAIPFNDLDDYTWEMVTGVINPQGLRSLDLIDEDTVLPLSERYFLGGLGAYQLRGFEARSVGPRSIIVTSYEVRQGNKIETLFAPVGVDPSTGMCLAAADDFGQFGGNGNGICNSFDEDIADFDETDVIGGSKFITASIEYRFPISDTLGLQGLIFLDTGNAFGEEENMFDIGDWRWGTGVGLLWFSPFGPLAAIIGIPLDPTSEDKSNVFEFSVGGQGF